MSDPIRSVRQTPCRRAPTKLTQLSRAPCLRGRRRAELGGVRGARRFLPIALVLFLVAPLSLGTVSAAPANAPTLQGAVVIGNGTALALIGYVGWADVWTQTGNDSQVYSQAAYLIFFNLRETPVEIGLAVNQSDGYTYATSLTIEPLSQYPLTLQFPANNAWTETVLLFDGVPGWHGEFATPISFLPSYIANVGGLDLFSLTIVSFMVVNVVGGFSAAKLAMRRAIYAPKFSLIIWGHVIIAGIAAAVFLDYQQIDMAFAGWSPVVYPFFTFPMAFLTGLSYFNRDSRVEILQGLVTGNGEMGYRRTVERVGRSRDGKLVWVGSSWGQFWARFWGHMPVLDDGDESKPRPWLAPVMNASPATATPRERSKARQAALRHVPTSADALTRFPVVDPQDTVAFIAWGKSSEPPRIKWPHLSIHRAVKVPAKLAPPVPISAGGTGLPTTLLPERTKLKLTWPHYVDEPSPTMELEDRHFVHAAAVWAGFATARDLGRVISKLGVEVAAYRAKLHNLVQDEVYTRLRAHYALVNRATSGITDQESAQVLRRATELLEGTAPDRSEPSP